MDNSQQKLTGVESFLRFKEEPKSSPLEILQGTHKYLTQVVNGSAEGPSNAALIEIFGHFSIRPIKNYVFRRMTKALLLELVICILQDIIKNGPARTATLELVVERVAGPGKTVVIAKEASADGSSTEEEFPVDKEFVSQIDEAFFSLRDSSGSSSEAKFKAGPEFNDAFSPPDNNGYFTPIKHDKQPRSLQPSFEVSSPLILTKLSLTHLALN